MIGAAAVAVAFSFARYGGNIVPFHATIFANGKVLVNDRAHGTLTPAQLAALRRVVAAQLFASLPAHISCPEVLPDIATETVTAVSHGSRHSVTVRGGCNRRFDRVYAALTRAVGSP